MSHPLPSQDAWARARSQYCEDLNEEERRKFLYGSLDDIVQDAKVAESEHREKSTSRSVVEKMQPLVSAIEQYGKALDVYTNAYPLVLSPLWGSIRVVLLLAREFGKYFDKLLDMLNQIGDVLPRFKVFERLFGNHEMVVEALSDVYVDIIHFCAKVKDIFRRGKRQLVNNLKIFGKLIWKPFEEQFGQQKAAFRRHVDNVEKSAGLSHMIEAASDRESNRDYQKQVQKMMNEERRQKITASLSNVDPEKRHRRLQLLHFQNTNQWMLTRNEYLAWKSSSSSTLLCIEGIPGSGKSVLVSQLLDDLMRESSSTETTHLYYYFDFADLRTLEFEQFLGSLVQQLYQKGKYSASDENAVAGYSTNGMKMPTIQDLRLLLACGLKDVPQTRLVVDGIDECDPSTRASVVDILTKALAMTTSCIQILLTCRNEIRSFRRLINYYWVNMRSEAHDKDLRNYIEAMTETLEVTNLRLKKNIVKELCEKSQGMFLWVHFQLQDLREATSEFEMENILDHLPRDLEEIYLRICTRICRNSSHQQPANKIFNWIKHAKRPLSLSEMCEAVAFDETDKCWVKTKSNTHRAARYSIDLQLGLEADDQFAADFCVTYLSFSDFETAVSRAPKAVKMQPTGILGPGGPGSIPKMLGLGNPVFKVTERFFTGPRKPTALDIDYGKILNVKPKAPNEGRYANYAMLNYVIKYWLDHAKGSPVIDSKLIALATSKNLPFEIRPWGPNRHFGPYGCVACPPVPSTDFTAPQQHLSSMFHWAAQEGHLPLLNLAFWDSRGNPSALEHLFHERESGQTLEIACKFGQNDALELLLQKFVFHSQILRQDILGSLMIIACKVGHEECVKIVARQDPKLDKIPLRRPLYEAAREGHASIVRQLIRLGAKPFELVVNETESPIHVAFRLQNMPVQLALTDVKSDEKEDSGFFEDSGFTALHVAALTDNWIKTKQILEHAADFVNVRNVANETVLSIAIAHENWSILPQLRLLKARVYNTALEVVIELDRFDIVQDLQYLLNLDDPSQNCFLHLAATKGSAHFLKKTLDEWNWHCFDEHLFKAFCNRDYFLFGRLLHAANIEISHSLIECLSVYRPVDGMSEHDLLDLIKDVKIGMRTDEAAEFVASIFLNRQWFIAAMTFYAAFRDSSINGLLLRSIFYHAPIGILKLILDRGDVPYLYIDQAISQAAMQGAGGIETKDLLQAYKISREVFDFEL